MFATQTSSIILVTKEPASKTGLSWLFVFFGYFFGGGWEREGGERREGRHLTDGKTKSWTDERSI